MYFTHPFHSIMLEHNLSLSNKNICDKNKYQIYSILNPLTVTRINKNGKTFEQIKKEIDDENEKFMFRIFNPPYELLETVAMRFACPHTLYAFLVSVTDTTNVMRLLHAWKDRHHQNQAAEREMEEAEKREIASALAVNSLKKTGQRSLLENVAILNFFMDLIELPQHS